MSVILHIIFKYKDLHLKLFNSTDLPIKNDISFYFIKLLDDEQVIVFDARLNDKPALIFYDRINYFAINIRSIDCKKKIFKDKCNTRDIYNKLIASDYVNIDPNDNALTLKMCDNFWRFSQQVYDPQAKLDLDLFFKCCN